jgi:hypothetical protein
MQMLNLSKFENILLFTLLSLEFFIFINYLFYSAINLSYKYDVMYDEGSFFRFAWLTKQGKFNELYLDHKENVFSTNINPPVFYIVQAILLLIFGDSLFPGRLISITSTLLIAFILYKMILKQTKNRIISLTFSIFIFTFYLTFYWTTVVRHDSLALLFSILAIYFIRDYKKDKLRYLSILFLLLAFYTKQTALLTFLAIFIFLLFRNRKIALTFMLKYLALLTFSFLIINTITGGKFFSNIITYNFLPLSNYYALGILIKFFLDNFIIIALAFVYVFRNIKESTSIYFIILFIFAVVSTFRRGVWLQNFFEPLIISGFLLSMLYFREKNLKFRIIILLLILSSIAQEIYFYKFLTQSIIFPEKNTALKNIDSDEQLINIMRSTKGNILSDHKFHTFVAGKEPSLEIWSFFKLFMMGKANETEFYSHIEKNNITMIIYRAANEYEKFSFFPKYLNENYNLISTLPFKDVYLREDSGEIYWKVYEKKSS